MRIKIIKSTLTMLLLSGTHLKAMDEVIADYSKVYTVKIYDQSEIKFHELNDENERNNIIKSTLKKKKKELINIKCITMLDKELSDKKSSLDAIKTAYDSFIEEDQKHQTKGTWFKAGIDLAAGGAGLFLGGPLGMAIGTALSSTITSKGSEYLKQDNSTTLKKKAANNHIQAQEYQPIKQLMEDLSRKRKILKKGIDKESETLLEKEEKYILIKRYLPIELQQKVEEAFIETRLTVFSNLEKPEAFIQKALSIPFAPKNLIEKGFKTIAEDFKKDEFFQGFDFDIQYQLLNVLREIYYHSSPKNQHPERASFYFWGEPGVGKTCAARNMAKLLDLPFFEMRVRAEADLSKESLEGAQRIWQNSQLGAFASALLSKDLQGQSYTNPILIINDFDRIFLGQSPTALSFLLDYLDVSIKAFFSNYFGCNLQIDRFTIIITGNEMIPSSKKYEALVDRVKPIEFKSLPQDSLSLILKSYMQQLSVDFNFKYNKNTLDNEITNILREEKSKSVRIIKRKLKDSYLPFLVELDLPPEDVKKRQDKRKEEKRLADLKKEEKRLADLEKEEKKRKRKEEKRLADLEKEEKKRKRKEEKKRKRSEEEELAQSKRQKT